MQVYTMEISSRQQVYQPNDTDLTSLRYHLRNSTEKIPGMDSCAKCNTSENSTSVKLGKCSFAH